MIPYVTMSIFPSGSSLVLELSECECDYYYSLLFISDCTKSLENGWRGWCEFALCYH